VAHRPDTPSDFSATVFERINPQPGQSRYVFAVRGTAGGADLVEDIANLVANGMAWRQAIDMYNWWQELTTPQGQTYQRAVATRTSDALGVLPNVVVEFGQAWRIDRIATTQTQTPVLPAYSVVDVTGHSLGGHLATAFSRLFTSNVANVVTINGAGYSVLGDASGNTNRVFATLGGQTSFPSTRILNTYGDRGTEFVTQDFGLVQPGSHRPASIENNSVGNTLGHGANQVSLSLALYDTLRQLAGMGTGLTGMGTGLKSKVPRINVCDSPHISSYKHTSPADHPGDPASAHAVAAWNAA
jgi:pimeloyl-ACP methyl ester carboxylesterase